MAVKPQAGTQIRWDHPLARGLVLCVPMIEGTTAPMDLVSRRLLTPSVSSGSIDWDPRSRYGGGYTTLTTGTSSVKTPNMVGYPTDSCTVVVAKRKLDATLRSHLTLSNTSGPGTITTRLQAQLAHVDGGSYWDFGGSSGANRLSVAGLTFSDDLWVLTAGKRGSQMIQGGILRASQTTPITRTNVTTDTLDLNTTAVATSDVAVHSLLYVYNRELTLGEAKALTDDPYQMLTRPSLRRSFLRPFAAPPTGLQRAAILYPINSTTVDTGAGIDIRALDDVQPGADDSTQSILNATQGTTSERTFDPATATVTAVADATATQGEGWAIPLAEMDPGDVRCAAVLSLSDISLRLVGTASGTGTSLGSDVYTPKMSLWKWNTSTNTGTLIHAQTGATTVSNLAAVAYGPTAFDVVISATISASLATRTFAANEVLFLQIGGSLNCAAGILGGARTFTIVLTVDTAATGLEFSAGADGNGLRQRCTDSQSTSGVGTATKTLARVRATRTATGVGTPTKTAQVRATRTATGVGGSNLLTANEAGFETSAPAGWVGANATLAQETSVASQGTKSLRMTATAPAVMGVSTPIKLATPGTIYDFDLLERAAVTGGRTVQAGITFYDAGVVSLLDVFGYGMIDSNSAWTRVNISATAPTGAVWVQGFVIVYSDVASEVHYVDAAFLGPSPVAVRIRSSRSTTGVGTASQTARVRATRQTTGIGEASSSRRVRAARQATGVGVPTFSRLWTTFRSAIAMGVGTTSSTRRVRATRTTDGIGVPSYDRSLILTRSALATGIGEPSSTRRVRATRQTTGVGVPTFTRIWTVFRSATATGVGEGSYVRHIIFVRFAQATGIGTPSARIGLDIDDLPDAGASPTIIRRIIRIFED